MRIKAKRFLIYLLFQKPHDLNEDFFIHEGFYLADLNLK